MSYLSTNRRAQSGVAAIEFALIIVVVFTLIAAAYAFGRVTWQYNAMQKATYDAARYLSSLPRVEIMNLAGYIDARDTARKMVRDAASVVGISLGDPDLPYVVCSSCGSPLLVPSSVQVFLGVALDPSDSPFGNVGFGWLPSLQLNVEVTVPYAN